MCRQNHDINSPINQIITGRDIYYIVGQKVIDGRIYGDQYQNVLPYLPRAQEAFIYEMQEGEKYYNDIGLLIVNIDDWSNRVSQNLVSPIDLPDNSERYIIN